MNRVRERPEKEGQVRQPKDIVTDLKILACPICSPIDDTEAINETGSFFRVWAGIGYALGFLILITSSYLQAGAESGSVELMLLSFVLNHAMWVVIIKQRMSLRIHDVEIGFSVRRTIIVSWSYLFSAIMSICCVLWVTRAYPLTLMQRSAGTHDFAHFVIAATPILGYFLLMIVSTHILLRRR